MLVIVELKFILGLVTFLQEDHLVGYYYSLIAVGEIQYLLVKKSNLGGTTQDYKIT